MEKKLPHEFDFYAIVEQVHSDTLRVYETYKTLEEAKEDLNLLCKSHFPDTSFYISEVKYVLHGQLFYPPKYGAIKDSNE